ADATGTNQPDVTDIFCGKPQRSPASEPTKARTTAESRRNPGFSFLPTVKQRQGMAGKPLDDSRRFIEREELWAFPKNERPVRGDNRTGQAIWALGVDGRSRRIQPRWGGITAPTSIGRDRVAGRSNGVAIFLTFWPPVPGPKITARRGFSYRLRRTCRTPWREPSGSRLWSRKRHRGPQHFWPRAGPKPRRPARWQRRKPPQRHPLRPRRTNRRGRGNRDRGRSSSGSRAPPPASTQDCAHASET